MYDPLEMTPKTRGFQVVFNHTNFHLYHYAGNNPIRYIDPDGRADVIFPYEKFLNCVMDDNRQISDNISNFTKGFPNTLEYCNEMADVCDTVNYCTAGMCFTLISYLKVNYLKNGSNYLAQDGFSYLVTAEKELTRLDFLIKEYGKNKDASSAIFTEFLTKQKELLQSEYDANKLELYGQFTLGVFLPDDWDTYSTRQKLDYYEKINPGFNTAIQQNGELLTDKSINYINAFKEYASKDVYKDFCAKQGIPYEE